MPQRILCAACGANLYDGLELESPAEIIQKFNGSCPQCKKKLGFSPESVRIIPNEPK